MEQKARVRRPYRVLVDGILFYRRPTPRPSSACCCQKDTSKYPASFKCDEEPVKSKTN